MQTKPTRLQPILSSVLEQAMALLQARSGSLMFLDEQTRELRIAVARGLPPDVVSRVRVREGEGIAGWVLTHSRPRLLRRQQRAQDSLSSPEKLPSAISAPLRAGRRTIGVINISDPADGEFSASHVRLLTAFAGQAAAAVENARLYESLSAKMGELSAIYRIGQALTSSLNLSRVLREVVRRATKTMGAASGSVMLLGADHKDLRVAAAVGLDQRLVRQIRLPVGQGIAGVVAQTGQAIVLKQGTVDPRSAGGRGHDHADAAMSVPLRVRDRVIGVLNVSQKVGGGNFSEEDLEFLTTLAGQAAVAIENARLYRRLQQRVAAANQELISANHLLAQEKQKIQAIVDGMADGVLVVNRRGRVTFLNPAAEAMLGLSAANVLGKGLKRFAAGGTLLAVMEDAGQSEGMSIVKEIAVKGKEERVLSANVSSLLDGRQRLAGYIAVLTDVTALKEISDMKTDLVSFVSHELRSPITSIRGFADTLRSGWEDLPVEMREEFCGIIASECDRLLSMVNEMLDVSRMEAGRELNLTLSPVDVPALLQRAVCTQRGYTTRHEVILEATPDLPMIHADADKLYQVLINLLSNAVKYSPDGGTITASASLRGDRVRISVADQGLGIPPEMIGKLFQRYYRVQTKAHTSIKGTGLGLFFVKGVVEAHGGSVWVESQYGKGSRFIFEVPVVPPLLSE